MHISIIYVASSSIKSSSLIANTADTEKIVKLYSYTMFMYLLRRKSYLNANMETSLCPERGMLF